MGMAFERVTAPAKPDWVTSTNTEFRSSLEMV